MKGILWGFHSHVRPAAVDDAVSIARVLIPTLFFLGTSAVFLSTLYALRGFTVPALAPSFYHLGIIGSALALARPLGILALPVGALTGATCQALLQVPALVRAGVRWWIRPVFSTEVRQIIRLYVPIAAGLLVSIAGQIVDIDFKWQVGARAVTAMQTATMLTQFPIGIAVAAVSFAVLPAISADAASDRLDQFKDTLVTALRFVFFLTVPAAVGFLTLSTPIIAMLFQSGHFSGSDTSRTATALLGYSIQIPFVGIDQLLIFAFYARRNTVTPMIVGVIGVCVYVIAALLLMPRLHIFGLALANTLQNSIHACILLTLLLLSLGSLEGRGIGRTAATVTVTGLGMGAACLASRMFLSSALPSQHLAQRAATALLPLLIGSGVYLGGSALLRSRELRLVWSSAQRFRVRQ